MNPERKSVNSHEWLLGIPALGKTLNQYFTVSSGCLWETLKTTFLVAIAITISLLVGQLH